MDDLISRQMALDAIMGQPPESHYPSWYAAQIEKLPDVQPETNCSEIPNSSDGTISRRAAIEALARMMPRSYTPDGSHPADEEIFRAQEIYVDCIESIEILPAVQPDHNADVSKKAEGDCISRQAAIECVSYDVEHTIQCLKDLPSIQKSYTKADYIMCLHKQYGCDLIKAEKAHEKALQYLRDNTLVRG